jgi:hypothetical protein
MPTWIKTTRQDHVVNADYDVVDINSCSENQQKLGYDIVKTHFENFHYRKTRCVSLLLALLALVRVILSLLFAIFCKLNVLLLQQLVRLLII